MPFLPFRSTRSAGAAGLALALLVGLVAGVAAGAAAGAAAAVGAQGGAPAGAPSGAQAGAPASAPAGALASLPASARARQVGEEEAVLAVVQDFFDGLGAADTEALAATLVPDGVMVSTRLTDAGVDWNLRSYADFLEGLAGNPGGMLERMWEPQVMIQGPLAVVWTPYDFHVGGAFSHCGIDAFTLIRTDEGWKTVAVAYTVEPTGCPPSPLGPPRR